MMKRTTWAWALAVMTALHAGPLVPAAMAQAKPKQQRGAIEATQEARDVVKALRSIDSRTASGINSRDYSREVGDLKLAVDALDELLERRNDMRLRDQLAQTFEPYQEAKAVWSYCVTSDECRYDLILLSYSDYGSSRLVLQLLQRYPALNAAEEQGGVLMDGRSNGRVHLGKLLSSLWAIGKDRSKTIRASLQPG